jgi:hypothetical protein
MMIVQIVGILAGCVTLFIITVMLFIVVAGHKSENRFYKIQKDFVSDDPDIRAVAALQLGDLAPSYSPRTTERKEPEYYPYLQPSASLLAVALNVETNHKVRIALEEAVKTMLNLASNEIGGRLKEYVVDTFANANQTALENYIKSLACYLASQSQEDHSRLMEKCALVSPFCGDNLRFNQEIVQVLCATEKFKAEMEVQRAWRASTTVDEEQKRKDAMLLANVQDAASRLISTRDAFAFSAPMRSERMGGHFKQQFLAGAELRYGYLKETDFEGAFFIGANLYSANISHANFDHAFLTFANLTYTYWEETSLVGANLQGAQFDLASLPFVRLTSAKVAQSNLNDARTVSASWKKADFSLENGKDEDLYNKMVEKFEMVPESYQDEYRYWEENTENWRTTND